MTRPLQLPHSRPLWQRISISAAQKLGKTTTELAAGIALGLVAMAVADGVTTSLNLRLGIAVAVCVAGVLAEWGVRVAAYRACRRNPSTDSQAHNLSIRAPKRRFRRG